MIPNPPARILVPYDLSKANLEQGKIFESETDPLAYMSKRDFTRLWNALQTDPVSRKRSEPFVAEIGVEGELLPEKAVVEGALRVLAVNPSNIPGFSNSPMLSRTRLRGPSPPPEPPDAGIGSVGAGSRGAACSATTVRLSGPLGSVGSIAIGSAFLYALGISRLSDTRSS